MTLQDGIHVIEVDHPAHAEECALRWEVLRKPLGRPLGSERFAFEDDARHVILALGGTVVGCVLLHPDAPGEGRLLQMAVRPDLQRTGRGGTLVRALEAVALDSGITTLHLHARLAVLGFYESLGYGQVGPEYEEVGLPHVSMEKALSPPPQGETLLVELPDVRVLEAKGPDRRTWLQGMVTQDVVEPFPGTPRLALILNGKGGIIADARIVDDAAETGFYLLLDDAGRLDAVRQHLGGLLVSEDVELEPTPPRYLAVTLQGPRAAALSELGGVGALSIPHDRTGRGGVDLLLPVATARDRIGLMLAGGARAARFTTLESARIAAGIPRWGFDFDQSSLPQEAGLHAAIHWGKGCYVGQEVVARLGHRGQTARELRQLHLTRWVPRGTELFLPSDEKSVGRITSCTQTRDGASAIGLVRRRAFEPGTLLRAGPAEATVLADPVGPKIPLGPENDPSFRAQRPQRGLGR